MNNSQVFTYSLPEISPVSEEVAQEKEARYTRIISALETIAHSSEWSTLKIEIFDGLAERTRNRLMAEAKGVAPDANKLNRLSGMLEWADRYADLGKLVSEFKAQLNALKNKHGKSE